MDSSDYPTPKYKVGDKVRVTDKVTAFDGKTGVIERIDEYDDGAGVYFGYSTRMDGVHHRHPFDAEELELIQNG